MKKKISEEEKPFKKSEEFLNVSGFFLQENIFLKKEVIRKV
jgi:hypothetical protein